MTPARESEPQTAAYVDHTNVDTPAGQALLRTLFGADAEKVAESIRAHQLATPYYVQAVQDGGFEVASGGSVWTTEPTHPGYQRSLHPIPSAAQLAALRKLVEVARHVANQLSFYKPTDREQVEYAESLRAAIKECEQP